MLDMPIFKKGITLFEKCRDPGGADACIEGLQHIVDHPEDGQAALGLTEVVALGGVMHLVNIQVSRVNEGLEKVEVISTTSFHHRHRR